MPHRRRLRPPSLPRMHRRVGLLVRTAVLAYCLCDALAKLFEPKSKKVERLTAELAALEAERMLKVVVVFGYEFDKLGFYTSVSISTVLFLALIIQLSRSRRKWKRLALSGGAAARPSTAPASTTTPRRTILLGVGALVFFYYLVFNIGKAFESKKGTSGRSLGRGGLDPRRLSRLVILFGQELDKPTFYATVATAMVLLVALGMQIGIWVRQWKDAARLERRLERMQQAAGGARGPARASKLDVVIVGCGPKSVGWFHLLQFLDMPEVNVRAVVEPFFLDKAKCPYPPQSFVDLIMMLDEMKVRCLYHVGQLGMLKQRTLCVIAGRTADNPRLFRECIGMGASHIYLESPGAPTIEQLKDMQSLAVARGVEVYMGYQRLCSKYIERTISLSRSVARCHVFFCHNETYASSELHFVVERYPEGMLGTMAAQELAVLVTQFGVRANEIEGFKVNTNRLFSEKQAFYNRNDGTESTDFSRVAFKITTRQRRSVSVMADRCGGLVSFAVVKSHTGKEVQRFESHDEDQASALREELRADAEISQQCTIERDEYLELKRRIVKRIFSGDGSRTLGLVSIHDGVEILALADYCLREINAVLKTDT
ncbi:hypothetical protein ACHAXT_008393 [Thalassiosira profunda]